jgi:thiol-disulfide isomerase/thioredoxin
MASYVGGGGGQEGGPFAGIALVKFTAPWCGPCRAVQPAYEAFAASCGVRCFSLDVDAEGSALERYRVEKLPTFLLLSDGAEVGRREGSAGAPAALAALLDEKLSFEE